MSYTERFTHTIDQLNRWSGWLTAFAVLIVTVLAVFTALARKFDIGSNALIEMQWYLFSLVFLLAAGWTLQQDQHVRVDVLAKRWSPITRLWIDLIGHGLVLLPLASGLFWLGLQQTISRYSSGEMSPDAGGLLRWPVWALLPLGFGLLILQTLAEMLKLWHQRQSLVQATPPSQHQES
ncbi:MAG: TRAP transporter small permease subunit [Pseudomonadota bacterium]|nr:TRAP transporter small permease subunit [Pseudomonadota bacterium]